MKQLITLFLFSVFCFSLAIGQGEGSCTGFPSDGSLPCGVEVWGNNNNSGNTFQSYNCHNSTFPGNDRAYTLSISETSDVSINLTGLSADLDLFLVVCRNGSFTCINSSTGSNNSDERINITDALGTYYIVVDAQYTSSKSQFKLKAVCTGTTEPDHYSCADATPLECGGTYHKTTIGGESNFTYNDLGACANGISQSNNPFTGNDRLFKITVPSQTTLSISMTGLSKDLDIFLFDKCQDYANAASLQDCVARSTNGNANNEQITLNNASGTYYLLVDGYKPEQQSNFTLHIDCDDCQEETDDNCSSMSYNYLNSNSGFLYNFSVASSLPASGVWTFRRVGSSQVVTRAGGRSVNASFASAGAYVVCYSYTKSDGCEGACCRTIYITNPYDCDDINYNYNQNSNTYTLNIPGITNATWFDDDNNTTIGTGTSVNVSVSGTCRRRNFSVKFYDPGLNAYRMCCISIYMCNPYDCDDITYSYNNNSNAYTLSIPGITNAIWFDDDNRSTIGTGTTVNVSVNGSCRRRNFSVKFFDPAVNAWRMCCISIYMCNPYDCDDITYGYNANTNSYQLNIPGISNANWYDDDSNTYIGSGSTVNVPVTNDCRARNFSVRFFDPAVNAWRICCIRIYICNPYDCNSIEKVYNANNNTWNVSVPGLSNSNILYWRNDATGQQIAGSTSSITVSAPPVGGCYYLSVHYFDPSSNCYRVCCLQICRDANGCTGTPSDGACTTDYTPVCGCDGNTYSNACNAITSGVYSWTNGTCTPPTLPDCDELVMSYVASLRYSFSVSNTFPWGSWTAEGGPYNNPTTIGSGRNITYTFPQAGVYTICYKYTENGVTKRCCKTIQIVGNPYDCNDITYGYNQNTSRYELSIPGISNDDVAYWQDDDANTIIGTSSTVGITVNDNCRRRNFSVVFFDAAVNAYRICCISIYICNPYDCDNITYSYNNSNNSYVLNIPGVSNATWYDDDTNTYLGSGTTVNVPVGNGCGIRNFSVRFYDPAVNAYRICCIAIYVCNPYNCNSIQQTYNAGSNTYTLALQGVPSSRVLMWRNDDTGQVIAGSTSSISINNPASGGCTAISVLFYDPSVNGYRVCCLEVCNDQPDDCAGITNEQLVCKSNGTYDYSFTLNNNSGQNVDAIFSMTSPIGVTFNNCSLKQEVLNIGSSRNITLNIDDCLVSLYPGMQVTYELRLQEAGKDEGWCCHLDPITITLPDCANSCQGSPQNISCTDVYEPVCGCNGVTYSNSCYAQRAGVQSIVSGPCSGNTCNDVQDLVNNSDFEGGNWAFTSAYNSGCYCGDNTYCIRDNARNKCGSWAATTGDGKFLIIEGAAGGAHKAVWKQTVAVQTGVNYHFSCDFYPNLTGGSQPVLRLYINGNPVSSSFGGYPNQWRTFAANWTASSTDYVVLEIRKVGSNGGTNDFGIDNVKFEFCNDSNDYPERDEVLTTKTADSNIDLMASPNPFVDVTSISFTLSSDMPATVSIFNMDGKQLFQQRGDFHAGLNTVEYKPTTELAAGIYYYRLETAEQTLTKSMILMKQ